jgi:hypothetical protein
MEPKKLAYYLALLGLILYPLLAGASSSRLYWCPQKLGGTIQDWVSPGCKPIIEARQKDDKDRKGSGRKREQLNLPPITNLDQAVSAFRKDYDDFLAHQLRDDDALEKVYEHQQRAAQILEFADSLPYNKLFSVSGRGVIIEVLKARDRLNALEAQLSPLSSAKDDLPGLDYEAQARERRRIEIDEEAIHQDFQPPPRRGSPPTGPTIGTTPTTGEAIGASGQSGEAIGRSAPTGKEIGSTPPGGTDNPNAFSGKVGPEIGTTPPTGPEIGNSDYNSTQ